MRPTHREVVNRTHLGLSAPTSAHSPSCTPPANRTSHRQETHTNQRTCFERSQLAQEEQNPEGVFCFLCFRGGGVWIPAIHRMDGHIELSWLRNFERERGRIHMSGLCLLSFCAFSLRCVSLPCLSLFSLRYVSLSRYWTQSAEMHTGSVPASPTVFMSLSLSLSCLCVSLCLSLQQLNPVWGTNMGSLRLTHCLFQHLSFSCLSILGSLCPLCVPLLCLLPISIFVSPHWTKPVRTHMGSLSLSLLVSLSLSMSPSPCLSLHVSLSPTGPSQQRPTWFHLTVSLSVSVSLHDSLSPCLSLSLCLSPVSPRLSLPYRTQSAGTHIGSVSRLWAARLSSFTAR